MNQQAVIDEKAREAQASSLIAQVESQNWQVEKLDRQKDIMKMQGRADALSRTQNYNETMEVAMVMGAASGRVFGEGSIQAIFDESKSNFVFEQMWYANNEIISEAAIEADKTNILKAGFQTLLYGAKQSEINRLLSQNQQEMQGIQTGMQMNQIQQSFDRSITQSIVGIGNAAAGAYRAYGQNLLSNPSIRNPRTPVYASKGKNMVRATSPVASIGG